MKSKTSFFNKTVFKKNLTRFAPVMAVYTLCLILGMMMLYQNNEEMGRTFWFASRMGGMHSGHGSREPVLRAAVRHAAVRRPV